MKNRDWAKKEAFDYENYLKPNGVWSLARCEELNLDFEGQLERYQLAVNAETKIPPGFLKWRGHVKKSINNLRDALNLKHPVGTAPEKMAIFAHHLGEKIKELKASTAG